MAKRRYPRKGDIWSGRNSRGKVNVHFQWRYTSAHQRTLYRKELGRGTRWKKTGVRMVRKGGRWF